MLFESPPSLEAQIALLAELQDALHFEDIDLVMLNDANPILRFEALSGRPLFCRDPGRRAGFASLLHQPACLAYDDRGYEHLETEGEPVLQVRYTPTQVGSYRYRALNGETCVQTEHFQTGDDY